MDPRLVRARIVKAALIVILLSGGWLAYRVTLRPDPARIEDWAEAALLDIFGPHVTHGRVSADLLSGVQIDDLKVQAPGATEPSLWADRVDIRHDPLALAGGVLRLLSVRLVGPKVTVREQPDGSILLDFPFDLPTSEGRPAPPPALVVERGTLRLVASETSERFRKGYVLDVSDLFLTALPTEDRGLDVAGGFEFRGLGMEAGNRAIEFSGKAHPEKGTLELSFEWPRIFLTPEVLDALAPALRERVEAQRLDVGPHKLLVALRRDPDVEGGLLRVSPEVHVTVRPGELPGTVGETVDAQTLKQLGELFEKIDLTLELSGNTINVKSLTSALAGGEAKATGKIEDDGKTVDLTIDVKGVRLEDPAIRKALGPLGEQVFEEFHLAGRADARVRLQRKDGGPFVWDAVVDLVDVTAAYFGREDPVLKTPSGKPVHNGFPYAAEHLSGRIRLGPDSVILEGLDGRHGVATVHVRGNTEKARDGSETGFVRWGEGPTQLRLTIEAKNIPVDKDLFDAVEGSEFAGFLDTYRLAGVVDRVVLDIVQQEPRDKVAVVELELDLDGETFVYAPFPLTMTDVAAKIVLLRPPVGEDRRGKEFHVEGRGLAAGARVEVRADLLASDRRGRVRVSATDVALEGEITRAILASEAGQGGLGEAWRFLNPRGRADVTADFPTYDDPAPESFRVTLKDAGIHLRPDGPGGGALLEGIDGSIVAVGSRVTVSEVHGTFGGAPVRVSGTLDGGPAGEWDLLIASEGVPVTVGLLDVVAHATASGQVFPAGVAIEPGGRLDLLVRLLKTQLGTEAERALAATVTVRNADLVVRLGALRVALKGGFEVEGDEVHLVGVTAEGSGVSLTIADAVLGPDGLRGSLSARFENLELTKELLDVLPEGVRGTLTDLTKDRRLDAIELQVDADPAGPVTIRGALGLKAREGAPAGGGPRGRFVFDPLSLGEPDAEGVRTLSGLVRLEGVTIDAGARVEDLEGEIALDELVLGDAPSGRGTLRVRSARVAGVAVTDLTGPVAWNESILRAGPLAASVHGGRLTGEVTAHTKPPTAFEGRLSVAGASLPGLLADLGAAGSASGTVDLSLEFENPSGALRDLVAVGAAEVRGGDLGDLPVIATLPALFAGISGGSKPKFTSAAACFTIEGEVVRADSVTLAGPLFRMGGFGTVTFEGDVDLTFTPQFVKSLLFPGSGGVPVVRDVLGVLREDPLYVVRVHGTLSDARPKLVPLPFLTGRHRARLPVYRASPLATKPPRRIPAFFR